jgi:hypothetical protein
MLAAVRVAVPGIKGSGEVGGPHRVRIWIGSGGFSQAATARRPAATFAIATTESADLDARDGAGQTPISRGCAATSCALAGEAPRERGA